MVRPLIDTDTSFDILLTIWSRVPNEDSTLDYSVIRDGSGSEMALSALTGRPLVEIRNDPWDEEVLFSDIVLRGVSLQDRGLKASVGFDLPLKRL